MFVFKHWMTKWLFLFFLCVGNVWCQVTNACQGGKTTNATLIRTVRCSLPHPTQILSIQTQSKSIKFEDHHLCTFSANYCRLKSGLCHLFSSFWKYDWGPVGSLNEGLWISTNFILISKQVETDDMRRNCVWIVGAQTVGESGKVG